MLLQALAQAYTLKNTINLNQFQPNEPVDGLYVYQANLPQLHNPIISTNQSTALTYGAVVTLDAIRGVVSNS